MYLCRLSNSTLIFCSFRTLTQVVMTSVYFQQSEHRLNKVKSNVTQLQDISCPHSHHFLDHHLQLEHCTKGFSYDVLTIH